MSNLSYCRFHNTAIDLSDCKDALEALLIEGTERLSRDELAKAKQLVSTCRDILWMVCDSSGLSWDQLEDDTLADRLGDELELANETADEGDE